jgi:The GLUG motif
MTEVRISRSLRLAIVLLAMGLFGSSVATHGNEMDTAQTSLYVFAPDQSQIVQTGGIAGVNWTHAVEGQFQLSIDSEAQTASFDLFDASATANEQPGQVLDPNTTFNATGLSGGVIDANTIEFGGSAPDGSDVLIALTFDGDAVHLSGQTLPPAGSADFFLFTLDAVAHRKYGGGTGEPNTPYLIATAQHLNAIGTEPGDWSKHFLQTADIDLGAFTGDQFNIIGTDPNTPFRGVFDGQGHTIANFRYATTHRDNVGLFGVVADPNARIENVTLETPNLEVHTGWHIGTLVGLLEGGVVSSCHIRNASVRGLWTVGGLIGRSGYTDTWTDTDPILTRIADCSYEGSVHGEFVSIGGLVGMDTGGAIERCFAIGEVTGQQDTGGLVGCAGGTIITDCYATSNVEGELRTGGLIGNSFSTAVDKCYAAGWVTDGHLTGGLINDMFTDTTTVRASFWDTDASGQMTSDGGEGKTTAEMQTPSTFLDAGWDFAAETENGDEDSWWILDGQDYPRLWWEHVLADDFGDGQAEPLWWVSEPYPEHMWVRETDGRLEFQATEEIDDSHAVYVSNGWRLDTTSDFAMRVDFYFAKRTAGDSWVFITLLPSLEPDADEPVARNIDFEAGCMNDQPFYLYEVIDDALGREESKPRPTDDGTLYLSYNAATDELYLSDTGYGQANAWKTVAGLLGTQWEAEPVYVALGGGSDHVALEAGEAYLDNFAISAGVLVPTDESND